MPFPLAHPAAILPFRRWCPRYLSFIGLVIGSVTPDIGYAFRGLDLNKFTHSLTGSLAFCLPLGILLALVAFALRQPVVSTLPAPHRQALEPFCAGPRPLWWRLALSVLIGAWTHIAFDALTHESALRAHQAETIREIASTMRRRELYQVLWVAISVVSMGAMALVYLRFLRRVTGSSQVLGLAEPGRILLWGGLVVGPYLVVAYYCFGVGTPGGPVIDKHTIYRTFQPYLVLLAGCIAILGLIRRGRG